MCVCVCVSGKEGVCVSGKEGVTINKKNLTVKF